MKLYRIQIVKVLIIVVWCTTFLHMTFFMATIVAFKLEGNRALVENTKKLIGNSTFEEERDGHESGGERGSAKVVDIIGNNFFHTINEGRTITVLIKFLMDSGGPRSGHGQHFSPPPDLLA